jgi:uncharacterized damage-inducible protein DinB
MRLVSLLAVVGASAAFAQAPANPFSAETKAAWATVKGYVLRSAEKMPEENYAFRPTPDVRSFGAILAHIADEHYLVCSADKGEKKEMAVEKTKTTKADILAALKDSVAYCDASYEALTDTRAVQNIPFYGRGRARIGALQFNITHDCEHYGNLVTYLRMKGLVPPSSEPRQ